MKFILVVIVLLICFSLFAQAADSLQQDSTAVVTANFDSLGVVSSQPDSIKVISAHDSLNVIITTPDSVNVMTAQPDNTGVTTSQADSLGYYKQIPDSPKQHNQMAYEYMTSGNYVEALEEYQAALALDPQDIDAWRGVLWANNSLRRWKDTIKSGTGYLREHRYDSDIMLFLAFAYFAKTDYLHARQCYNWSELYTGWNAANTSGMAWTFRMLGDYPSENTSTKIWNQIVPDSLKESSPQPPQPLYFGHAQFAYATWNNHERAFLHHYTARYQTISVTSGIEDIWQKKDHLRTDYLASLEWDTIISNIEWRGHWLKGDYKNLYPAYSHMLSLSKPMYVFKTVLAPGINASYSHYPVLSVSQMELKLSYIRDGKWLSYSNAFMYKDYESAGIDTRSQWATWDVGLRLLTHFTIDLYTSHGDRTFYVGKELGVVDNYISAKRQTGLFASYRYKILNLGLNYSKEKQVNNENSTTTSLTLGLDYSPVKSH
jgi:tetratricopeptide (TPR) repeat protein